MNLTREIYREGGGVSVSFERCLRDRNPAFFACMQNWKFLK